MAALPKVAFFVRIFALKPHYMNNQETNTPDQKPLTQNERKVMTTRKTLVFSLEFGFMIALPLVIFAFTGKWLAHRYDNMGFFYGGLVLALLISTGWFWKRITDIYNDYIN